MKLLMVLALFGQVKPLSLASSLLVPGTGEWMMGARKKGEIFLWIDGALWLFYGGYTYYGKSKENNARLLAARYAGANISLKDDSYYNALEEYDNSEEYNEDILREARDRFPDSLPDAPQKRKEYLESHGYFGKDSWDWNPDSVRLRDYHGMRNIARDALRNASSLLGVLLANRIISFIDCVLFTQDKRLSKRMGFFPVWGKPGIGFAYRF